MSFLFQKWDMLVQLDGRGRTSSLQNQYFVRSHPCPRRAYVPNKHKRTWDLALAILWIKQIHDIIAHPKFNMVHPENDSFQSRNLLFQGSDFPVKNIKFDGCIFSINIKRSQNEINKFLPTKTCRRNVFFRVKFRPPKQKCSTPTFVWNFIALMMGNG